MKLFIILLAAMLSAETIPIRTHHVKGVFQSNADIRWAGRSQWAGRYPAYVLLRASKGDATPTIVVEGFRLGNRLYKDPKEFLKKTKAVSKGRRTVAGKRRTLWERSFDEPIRFNKNGTSAEHKIRERIVIIERNQDFLVARLKADEEDFESRAKEFDAFLTSFKLLE